MKTTVEIPDALFRNAKAFAARNGCTFREFLTQALEQRLRAATYAQSEQPWLRHCGVLKDIPASEYGRIEARIDEACEEVDDEEWE
jgi:hypothetical protein